ncbi:rRNA methyltransferase [Lipingzhangella sp. LS1_29]|uniref:rRNA methyltransferase n=1 Tax=Lipingzhangella rawalii TaxID=2055835 RepID=A0ABU2H8T3_9ACTN|nr:rRNA methyltransferase [Lipingzhangella rawalii]MDS1271250.1 rRNA methyltransferase [Lipingzhangella rawalii]
MPYRHVTYRTDNSDLAPGVVLRSAPGHPGFPVRLASELLLRAREYLGSDPLHLWDPCCGSGYLLTVLALAQRRHVASVFASDIDRDALGLATQNLALLADDGLEQRARALQHDADRLGKPSLMERARAAHRLAALRAATGGAVPYALRPQDVFAPETTPAAVDVVCTDVPYGTLTDWSGAVPNPQAPIRGLVRQLAHTVPPHAVLVVVARTRKIVLPPALQPLQRVRLGARAAVLVRAGDAAETLD